MMGLALRLYLAIKLGRAAHAIGKGAPTMSVAAWWVWAVGAIVVQYLFFILSLTGRIVAHGEVLFLAFSYILVWILFPALICWIVGRYKLGKPVNPEAMFHVHDRESAVGIFPFKSIESFVSSGKFTSDAWVCPEGRQDWIKYSELVKGRSASSHLKATTLAGRTAGSC